jgi:cytochrome c biogenesis protein CcdA
MARFEMSPFYYSFSISLFDSLSTTLQIIVFVLLLTTAKPLRNSLYYLAGLSGAYFACGVAGYLALDQLGSLLRALTASQNALPSPVYYAAEFLTGVVMIGLGAWYFYWKKKRGWSKKENWVISKLRTMNSLFALGLGLFISLTSFPVSFPYFIALGKYAALHLELPAVAGFILLYNIGYALPMVLILGGYLFARRGIDEDHDALHEKAKMLNLHLTTWTLVGSGLFIMADAGCYFALGHALLKERFL